MKIIFRVLMIAFLIFAATQKALASSEIDFLVLTDIHFDPFISCHQNIRASCPLVKKLQAAPASQWPSILLSGEDKPATYWRDSPYSLLKSALNTAKQAAGDSRARFVLILGDNLSHNYRKNYRYFTGDSSRSGYEQFVRKTFLFLNAEFERAFPAVSVYSLVGNNDSYHGNYYSNPNGGYYAEMAQLWSRLIKDSKSQSDMRREFLRGGYYAVNLPSANNLRLIMLNTVLFSTKARGKHLDQAAEQEFEWLHRQLMQAKQNKQRVLIAMHIPESFNIFKFLSFKLPLTTEFWQPGYIQRFEAEIRAFSPEVVALLSGHVHSGWFKVRRFNNGSDIPAIGVPSISPVYGNYPSFTSYTYSLSTGRLEDLVTYYYPMQEGQPWQIEDNPNNFFQTI